MKLISEVLYRILQVWGSLIYFCPHWIKSMIAWNLARLLFSVFRWRRRVVLHNISLVFKREKQEAMGIWKKRSEKLALRHYQHLVYFFFEIFERFAWNDKIISKKVRIVGLDECRESLPKMGSAFLLTAHLGPWELHTRALLHAGIPLTIVTRFLRNPFFDALWVRSRRDFGLEMLQESGSGRAVVSSIRKGRVIGFILDQHTGLPHGIPADFCGVPAWCPKGLAILSHRLEAPVFPSYFIRESGGQYTLYFEKALRFEELEKGGRYFRDESRSLSEESLRYHIGVCNENIETWIRRHPEQFLWVHKRFKETHDYSSSLPWDY